MLKRHSWKQALRSTSDNSHTFPRVWQCQLCGVRASFPAGLYLTEGLISYPENKAWRPASLWTTIRPPCKEQE